MNAIAKRNVTEMETYSGRYVDLLNPQPEQIALVDIARDSRRRVGSGPDDAVLLRRGAQRSLRRGSSSGLPVALAALFHDAHEAYTGDITSPMKRVLGPELEALQDRLDVAIAQHFGFPHEWFKSPLSKRLTTRCCCARPRG